MLIIKNKFSLLLCIIFNIILCGCSKEEPEFKHISSENFFTSTKNSFFNLIENRLILEADTYFIYDENGNPFYVNNLNIPENIYYQDVYNKYPGNEIVYENEHFKIILYAENDITINVIDIQSKNTLKDDWRYIIAKDLNLSYYDVVRNIEFHKFKNYNIDFSNEKINFPDHLTTIYSQHYYLAYENEKYNFISSELGYLIQQNFYLNIPLQETFQSYKNEVQNNMDNLKDSVDYISLLSDEDWKYMTITYYDRHGLIKFQNHHAVIYCYYSPISSHIIYAEYYDKNIINIANQLNISTWELDQNAYLTENEDIKYIDLNNDIHIYDQKTSKEKFE